MALVSMIFSFFPLQTVAKDVLSLGVIEEIYKNAILIVLPNRTTGKVDISSISALYLNYLEEQQQAMATGNEQVRIFIPNF